MGYRSTVVLAVEKELFELEKNKIKEAISGADSIGFKDNYYYIRWNYVKWYDGYPNVITIEDFIDNHSEKTRFLRLGENVEDIEENGEAYEAEVSLIRDIKTPSEMTSVFI